MRRLALALLAAALASCGIKKPLEPPPGEAMPAAAPMASEPLTTEQLLTPPPIARPERVDELLRRSEERQDDRFDLPPADRPGDTVTIPESGDEEPE